MKELVTVQHVPDMGSPLSYREQSYSTLLRLYHLPSVYLSKHKSLHSIDICSFFSREETIHTW
jgi:hypothetical protein